MDGTKKYKVLITDDDSFLLDMYSIKFAQAGFEVDTASGGDIVLEKFAKGLSYDLMLVDLMMPGMDGFHLLEHIMIQNLAPNTTKIVLSNLGSEADMKKCKGLGVDGYIVKANATPNEVVAEVKKILSEKK